MWYAVNITHFTILLKIKICFIAHLFLLFLWKNYVLSFKENYMATLIVEGGWTSKDNNLSLHIGWATTGNIRHNFCYEDSSENDLLFCGIYEKYPIIFLDHWLITTRRVVAVARPIVATLNELLL